MVKQITKSDGTKASFDVSRITRSISKAAKDAKIAPIEVSSLAKKVTHSVVKSLDKMSKVSSGEIREAVLSELDEVAPAVSSEWRKFVVRNKK